MNLFQWRWSYLLPVALVLFLFLFSSFFTIQEGHQAIITQFGRPIRVVAESGLHSKLPFIQEVRMIDMRILNWDGFPNQIPTKDKKYIEVDTTARWKIIDPLVFIQTVQDENRVRSRLDAILDGITRDIISAHNLVEAVRDSNTIFDVRKAKQEAMEGQSKAGGKMSLEDDEITGEIEAVSIGREKLSEMIIVRAKEELKPLGILLIDVQLRRISYEAGVQKKVYSRMISERQRIAEKIKSIGQGERAKIEGKTERDLQTIRSEAYKKVQEIQGTAEASAIKIYAKSLGRDPKFYEFTRTLDLYTKGIKKESRFLLSTDSQLWQTLKKGY